MHNIVFEKMNSRKYDHKLFEYKNDPFNLRKDVAALLLEFKEERRYDTTYFAEEVVSKFLYLFR